MKNLKERQEIAKEDCWDLSYIIKNEAEYLTLIKEVKAKNKEIMAMKGSILNSPSSLLHYFEVAEEKSRKLERLILYTKLRSDEDTRDNARKGKLLEIESLADQIHESESFVLTEFMEKDYEDVKKYMDEEEKLKVYDFYLKNLYKDKKRVLSEKEEAIIAQATTAFGTPDNAFESLDIADATFGTVSVSPRKKVELSHYNYGELLENKDQKVREQAFKTYYAYYKNHKNTFASLLKGNYQELEFIRNIRKYPTALEMELDSIDVTKAVYENLISSVNQNMDLNIRFQKLKYHLLGVKEYHLYDTYAPVVDAPHKSYTKESAISLVLKALEPLGKDYIKHFQTILDEHTVDFYPSVGKHNGAYEWGVFDTPSYVLLNFNGTFDSVSTLAHEMGHAIHSMYSKSANPYLYSDYELFLAEIASTVNETLLSFYVMEHAKNKKEKIYYLCEFLDKVKATIYRQTMFSEFERMMSEGMQNHESLTEEVFSDTYYKLNQEYFKDSVIIDDEIRYEWMRISHFYRPFYVYQYATGLISALCIVSDITSKKKDAVEHYINFLKSGSSKKVLDILKMVDVDFTTTSPFEKAFHLIEEKLEELESIVKEGEFDE